MKQQPKIGDQFIYENVDNVTDCTAGKVYTIARHHPNSGNAQFIDDAGDWNSGAAPTGSGEPRWLRDGQPSLTDIHGQSVRPGDYIAYAFAGGKAQHLAVFEVKSVTGPVALCRSVIDSAVTTLGVFEQRALKLNNYNK